LRTIYGPGHDHIELSPTGVRRELSKGIGIGKVARMTELGRTPSTSSSKYDGLISSFVAAGPDLRALSDNSGAPQDLESVGVDLYLDQQHLDTTLEHGVETN
jgi:hypothetical protein